MVIVIHWLLINLFILVAAIVIGLVRAVVVSHRRRSPLRRLVHYRPTGPLPDRYYN